NSRSLVSERICSLSLISCAWPCGPAACPSSWCAQANLSLFTVRRAHLELFGRWMEETGRMRSTVARRLSTLASFYRYCEEEGLIDHNNPALNVRRPKLDYESRTLGLDRNELGAFLVQAGLGSPRDHALASLLALNGLRISEALGADIEDLDFERGHRTLKIVRKGGKHTIVPLAPRTSRALDLYVGDRTTGPIFLGEKGGRMDRYAADRTVKRLAAERGSPSESVPTASGIPSSPPPSTPACRCETCRRQPATPIRGPPCATTGVGNLSIAMRPTSWRRSWPAPHGKASTACRYRAGITAPRDETGSVTRHAASHMG
ncbi:MAG TPA: tyrosine-type recombinase/integrase, partial [Acidimicrobiales bacterium]|nr:tyrosine-type recombinase/integrase [Acidimicrobiales bacterium]